MGRFHSTESGQVPYTADEEAEADALEMDAGWDGIRLRRDRLLRESDWVTLRAYSRNEPVPGHWAAYMQALRDITLHPSPAAVAWPAKPSS